MDKISVISNDIYKIISAPSYAFVISMFDGTGAGTISPVDARWYYIKPINAMIQIPDENDREEIYFWKSKAVKNTQTIELLKRLKHACNKFGYGFTISDFGSSNIPKKFSHLAMRISHEKVDESAYTGTPYRSYYIYENVKMTIVHSDKIDETKRGARTRKISEIFIETGGERRKFPNNHLRCAKAMVNHLGHSGSWDDRVGSYIREVSGCLVGNKSLIEKYGDKFSILGTACSDNINQNILGLLKSRSYQSTADRISGYPRIGKDLVKHKILAHGLDPRDSGVFAYVKHDLLGKCNELPSYYDELVRLGANARLAKTISRGICFGDLTYNVPQLPPKDDPIEMVKLCAADLAKTCDNQTLLNVLENIQQSDVTPNTAKLLFGMIRRPEPSTNTLVEADGDHYFEMGPSQLMDAGKYKSREMLIYMHPMDFLAMAHKLDKPNQQSIDNINNLVASGKKFDSLPMLQFNNNGDGTATVVGHEGRHRMLKLYSMGVKSVPVRFCSNNIRWSEQDDPSNRDYIKIWPNVLVSENGSTTIKFPVDREITDQETVVQESIIPEHAALLNWINKQ